MEWIKQLNQAITYIENNLEGSIDYGEAAKIACCTTFHFQRMFSYIADVPLSEYIRRRRMTKAAFDLQNSNIQVVDLAVKYGYDSPTSFSRAFKTVHRLSPSAARRKGALLSSYPKLIFSLTVKGSYEMRYHIEEKPEIRVVGVRNKLSLNMENNFIAVPEYWANLQRNKQFDRLCQMENLLPNSIIGITEYLPLNEAVYTIAVATDQVVPNGMVEFCIPATTWAVFECTGPYPDSIQTLYRRFYTEWLPFSGCKYAQTYDVEVYPFENPLINKTEVWFAIQKTYN